MLQSCHMAFDNVSEEAVYACTGNPMPRDIEQVVNWLFNEPLTDTFNSEHRTRSIASAWASRSSWRSCSRCCVWPNMVQAWACGTRGSREHARTATWHGTGLPCIAVVGRVKCGAACMHAEVIQLQLDKGIALIDIVREIHP